MLMYISARKFIFAKYHDKAVGKFIIQSLHTFNSLFKHTNFARSSFILLELRTVILISLIALMARVLLIKRVVHYHNEQLIDRG